MARHEKTTATERREYRVRNKLRVRLQTTGRMRLTVNRSGQHIYAQVVDDSKGHTVVAASTLDKDLRTKLKSGASKVAAAEVGKLLGERAVKAGVKLVAFDRGSYRYHGRVKELADGARAAGLEF